MQLSDMDLQVHMMRFSEDCFPEFPVKEDAPGYGKAGVNGSERWQDNICAQMWHNLPMEMHKDLNAILVNEKKAKDYMELAGVRENSDDLVFLSAHGVPVMQLERFLQKKALSEGISISGLNIIHGKFHWLWHHQAGLHKLAAPYGYMTIAGLLKRRIVKLDGTKGIFQVQDEFMHLLQKGVWKAMLREWTPKYLQVSCTMQ